MNEVKYFQATFNFDIADQNHLFSLSFFLHDFQDDHKAFRRQLEDKRPIVESNLLSGKQYVASEPPVSDASDTEGMRTRIYFVNKFFIFTLQLIKIELNPLTSIKLIFISFG